jgi:hypothetical protein
MGSCASARNRVGTRAFDSIAFLGECADATASIRELERDDRGRPVRLLQLVKPRTGNDSWKWYFCFETDDLAFRVASASGTTPERVFFQYAADGTTTMAGDLFDDGTTDWKITVRTLANGDQIVEEDLNADGIIDETIAVVHRAGVMTVRVTAGQTGTMEMLFDATESQGVNIRRILELPNRAEMAKLQFRRNESGELTERRMWVRGKPWMPPHARPREAKP